MSVSSVKNLNGETFSAVQDAALTDLVSSNSANWNEISAYQANSGSYLTAVPESAISGFATHEEVESATSGKMNIADMTAYQTVEDMSAYQPS